MQDRGETRSISFARKLASPRESLALTNIISYFATIKNEGHKLTNRIIPNIAEVSNNVNPWNSTGLDLIHEIKQAYFHAKEIA